VNDSASGSSPAADDLRLWKEQLQRLEAIAGAKSCAGRHWNGADTPFDKLIEVAEWMRTMPNNEQGVRELRRLAGESTADDFAVLSRFAERAESLNLVIAFQSAYDRKSTIHVEAERQAHLLAISAVSR
jgi:hypothetical protein